MNYAGHLEAAVASEDETHPAVPSRPEDDPRTRRDLCAILGDGASFSVMVGVGESYLPAFVLALGISALPAWVSPNTRTLEVAAGLVATVPFLAGALLQLVSPLAVSKLGSYRRWVVLCAAVQAGSFLPLVAAALFGQLPLVAVFLIASVYWGAGMATGPAWNTWVETIVPRHVRAHFFARRTRMTQAGVLAGFVGGGLALHLGEKRGHSLEAFALIFLAAAICRFVSAALIASQSEPVPPNGDQRRVSFPELLRRLRHGGDGRLILYLVLVQGSVQIAGPYFVPFMLEELHFSYATFVGLISVSFLAKALAAPLMGSIAHRWGARRLLWIGGITIIPMSGLWLLSDNFYYLAAVQAAAGVAWAGYELAMFLMFFESIRPEERTSVLTTYNVVNAVSTVAGSLLGGVLLAALGGGRGSYLAVFALSSAARALTLLFLRRIPDNHRPSADALPTRTLAIRPEDGSIATPILPVEIVG